MKELGIQLPSPLHDAISEALAFTLRFKARDANHCLIRRMTRIGAVLFIIGAMVAVNYQRAENGGFQHG